jgi:hypothetical protein
MLAHNSNMQRLRGFCPGKKRNITLSEAKGFRRSVTTTTEICRRTTDSPQWFRFAPNDKHCQ